MQYMIQTRYKFRACISEIRHRQGKTKSGTNATWFQEWKPISQQNEIIILQIQKGCGRNDQENTHTHTLMFNIYSIYVHTIFMY